MRRADGFSLLETLVALAIFSLAVVALLNLAGENTRTAQVLEQRTLAGIVADNQAVAVLTAAAPPPVGDTQGEENQGGRGWRWTQHVLRTQDPAILRIDLTVRALNSDVVAANLSLFRAAS